MNAHQLGACLYIPATHPQLHAIARGEKLREVRSVIYCTEDSVAPHDLPRALTQLAAILGEIPADCPRNRFIRLRDPATMQHILKLPHLERIHGFVLPKITAANLDNYAPLLDTPYRLMPTLESADTYLESAMLRLLEKLEARWKNHILCLRIGGNDLISHLHLRRPRDATLYTTPVGSLIDRLVGIYKPHGYHLSAPVFEILDQPELLAQEVREDLRHGLTGKTAIHPAQVPLIEAHYRVHKSDHELATRILADDSAIFRADGAMQEKTTHSNWARSVLQAAEAWPLVED